MLFSSTFIIIILCNYYNTNKLFHCKIKKEINLSMRCINKLCCSVLDGASCIKILFNGPVQSWLMIINAKGNKSIV